MSHYFLIKTIHVGAATVSFLLFCVRLYWSIHDMSMLQRGWVKVIPHVVDTVLLLAGISLMLMLRAWPQQQAWLAVKLVGVLVYIGLGTVAIKRGHSARVRRLAGLLAIAVFVLIVGAAWTHSPWSWFGR